MNFKGYALHVLSMVLTTFCQLTAVSAFATVPTAPGALVFLHGLGNSGASCVTLIQDRLLQLEPNLSSLKFVFPSAPRCCSSINGGQCLRCWFDLYDWPVGLSVRDDREGILRAVEQVEEEIEKLELEGIPRSRIVVGGFSQGATLALETVYRGNERFAGCIALSGWLARRDDLHCTEDALRTALFWGHGQRDKNVRPEQQFFGLKKLMQQGVRASTKKSYDMGHGVSMEELYDMVGFLKRVLPLEEEDSRPPPQPSVSETHLEIVHNIKLEDTVEAVAGKYIHKLSQ